MNNYQQKLFLLCTLLIGCVLTSLGVEYFTTPDEPIPIQPPNFVQQEVKPDSKSSNPNHKRSVEAKALAAKSIEVKSMEEKSITTKNLAAKKQATIININTATAKELDTLPGIGPVIAQRIVDYRDAEPFETIEDIMLVKGIGKKKFAKMKELITVE